MTQRKITPHSSKNVLEAVHALHGMITDGYDGVEYVEDSFMAIMGTELPSVADQGNRAQTAEFRRYLLEFMQAMQGTEELSLEVFEPKPQA